MASQIQRNAARKALTEHAPTDQRAQAWYTRMADAFDLRAADSADDDPRRGRRVALAGESRRRAEVLRGNGFVDWLDDEDGPQ
jgi:hypothetical protein